MKILNAILIVLLIGGAYYLGTQKDPFGSAQSDEPQITLVSDTNGADNTFVPNTQSNSRAINPPVRVTSGLAETSHAWRH